MKKLIKYQQLFKLTWRTAWYGVFVWILSFIISGVVILPWFYGVFPISILLVSHIYFGRQISLKRRRGLFKGAIFAQGLSAGFFWFFAIFIFDFIQFVGLDFSGASVYFLDSRNFIKYPFAILIPTLYALIVENRNIFRGRVYGKSWFSPV